MKHFKDAKTKTPIVAPLPPANKAEWSRTHGSYLNGQAYVDHVDNLAIEMEAKWGVGQLRLLADPDLAAKFDRQTYKLNHAIRHGTLDQLKDEAKRMYAAWQALDRQATQKGAERLSPDVWEVALPDGSVAALCQSRADASHVIREGRWTNVYTLDEIAKLIAGFPELAKVKEEYPGAAVTGAKRIVDPMDQFHDTGEPIDDIPF